MVIEVQIDEAASRLRELIVQLGPEDEVLIMDQSLPLATISRPDGRMSETGQGSSREEWLKRLTSLGSRYQPTGVPVNISRENFYEE